MKTNIRRIRQEIPYHIMLIPAVIITSIYAYWPMYGVIMAFQKFNPALGFSGSKWVGLKNFKYIFNLPDFGQVFWNSFYLSIMKIFFETLIPLIMSLLINEIGRNWFRKVVQTSIFIPYFLSWAVLGGIIFEVFSLDGPINAILQSLGIEPVFFMGDNNWFPFILISTDVWKNMGYNIVIFIAAITNISLNLYEASAMDGAGRLKQAMHITLPGILPIIVFIFTLSMVNILNAGFEQVFMLYSTPVYPSSDIIDTFVYRLGLMNGQLSPAAAVGLFKSGISLAFVSISYYLAYRFNDYRIF